MNHKLYDKLIAEEIDYYISLENKSLIRDVNHPRHPLNIPPLECYIMKFPNDIRCKILFDYLSKKDIKKCLFLCKDFVHFSEHQLRILFRSNSKFEMVCQFGYTDTAKWMWNRDNQLKEFNICKTYKSIFYSIGNPFNRALTRGRVDTAKWLLSLFPGSIEKLFENTNSNGKFIMIDHTGSLMYQAIRQNRENVVEFLFKLNPEHWKNRPYYETCVSKYLKP